MAEIADLAEEQNPFLKIKADEAYKADPNNPFNRIKAAEASGVDLNTEAPVGQPGFFGGLADVGRGLAMGAISTFPKQLGQAAEFFGAPETGRALQDFAEQQRAAHPELEQSQVGQIANAEDLSIRGGAYGAGENTPLSHGPALAGAAAGAGLGALAGPPGALAGAGIGYVVGSLAALPAFYGSQAQQSKETIKEGLLKQGVPEAEAERQSNIGGHLSGAVESGGELVADIIPFHALFNPLAKAVKGQLVKSALGGVGRKIAATTAGVVTAEVSTEMAQQALEDQIEKEYGSQGPGATWKSTLSVVVPTALMTLIPGGFTAAHTFRTNLQVRGALANPEADPEQRAAAASLVFHSIKGEDPMAAHAFDVYASNMIAEQKPIEIKDDAGYKEDLLRYLQNPEDSVVDPLTGVRPVSPAEQAGIDENGGPLQQAVAPAVNDGTTTVVQAQQQAAGAEEAAAEAQKQAEQQQRDYEAQRKEAWSGLDRRLKVMANEATALAAKAKENAPAEGEPELPAIHQALTIASQAHWDPRAATRALQTALDAKRSDVVHAIVERAQRVAEEANQARPSVPPESPMYGPIQAKLAKDAERAQTVADKLAAMAKLTPQEGGNAIQVPGPGGPISYQPTPGDNTGQGGGIRQGDEGNAPPQAGPEEGGGRPGGGGEPAGPGPGPITTGPSTPGPVGQGEGEQGHPPNVPGPETPAGPEVVQPEQPKPEPTGTTAGPTATPQGPEPNPTPGQIEAGNYRKEHITAAGFPVTIENREGMTRRSPPGVTPAWESVIKQADYGYIKRTEGADGDHVDAFVKPGTAPEHAGPVFVIDQQGKDGTFDEHKVMLGYANQLEAVAAYKANYPKGWAVGPVTETTNEGLRKWLDAGDMKKPFAEHKGEPLDQLVQYDKLQEKGTENFYEGKIPARDALDDIEKRLEFARAMRECLGV